MPNYYSSNTKNDLLFNRIAVSWMYDEERKDSKGKQEFRDKIYVLNRVFFDFFFLEKKGGVIRID